MECGDLQHQQSLNTKGREEAQASSKMVRCGGTEATLRSAKNIGSASTWSSQCKSPSDTTAETSNKSPIKTCALATRVFDCLVERRYISRRQGALVAYCSSLAEPNNVRHLLQHIVHLLNCCKCLAISVVEMALLTHM